MRATVEFQVHGASHQELVDLALKMYREYLQDENVKLPPSTHIDVSPEVMSGDGTLLTWSGTVTVSVNNSTFS